MRDATEAEFDVFKSGHCPFCGSSEIQEGPSGGASQNLFCANDQTCKARFNVGVGMGTLFAMQIIDESQIPQGDWYVNKLPAKTKAKVAVAAEKVKTRWSRVKQALGDIRNIAIGVAIGITFVFLIWQLFI